MRTAIVWTGRSALILLVALLASLPARVAAQGAIRGYLVDSLRGGGPVEGADVVLMGAQRRVTTEADGAFLFSDLPAGNYIVAYWAPWLDSLGLPAIQREVRVRDGWTETVTLATPSPRSIQVAVCGEALGAEQGILIGEVRGPDGAPAAGVGVYARWLETVVVGREVAQGTMAAADTAAASGSYVLCGVPLDAEFSLRALGQGVGSGELLMRVRQQLARRDVIVATAAPAVTVTGRLMRANGAAVAGATVAVVGDSGRSARSDDSGRFVLPDVPQRSSQLIVRSLGFVPLLLPLDPFDTAMELDSIRLEDAPRELAAMTVTGRPMTAAELQFEVRRERASGGVFIDESQLSELGVVSANSVATMAPRIAVQQTREGPMMLMRRGSEFCRPRFFIDGYDFRDITANEENTFLRSAKRVEIYTANNAPPQFNDFNGCGSVVIWTY